MIFSLGSILQWIVSKKWCAFEYLRISNAQERSQKWSMIHEPSTTNHTNSFQIAVNNENMRIISLFFSAHYNSKASDEMKTYQKLYQSRPLPFNRIPFPSSQERNLGLTLAIKKTDDRALRKAQIIINSISI